MRFALFVLCYLVLVIALINFFTIRTTRNTRAISKSVTVLLPVRNEQSNVGACVAGLMAQKDVKQLQVIVINDQSIDNTAEVLSEVIGADSRFTPPTFLISFSVAAAEEFLPTIGFDWARVVHGDQRFLHHRDVRAGDELSYSSEIESYKNLAGNEFVSIRTDFVSALDGENISSTWSTLVFRGEQA